ncbi:MAG: carboxypeptidase regulatory-like domain-containing protein [Gemmatimonadales bacterium]|nr:carboxypeptidase regulatory-like domain-containing protein [Gemmatimonadales bacterium]
MAPKLKRYKYLAACLAVLAAPTPGSAQVRIGLRDGALIGVVRDSSLGTGLGYALVSAVGADRRTFAADNGTFRLTGLRPGSERIRVQQIGYAPIEVAVTLVDEAGGGSERLVIDLGRRIQVLPEVIVQADGHALRTYRQPKGCVAPAKAIVGETGELVLNQAVTNADRILTLERDYPYTASYEHARRASDTTDQVVARAVDTLVVRPSRRNTYQAGRVLVRRRSGNDDAYYFAVPDLAREAFQKAHCAWYLGADSAEGKKVHQVGFSPAPNVKGVDWAGTLSFDWETFQLVRSDAWLVQIKPNSSQLQAARCAVNYLEVIPTLVHENLAYCLVSQRHPQFPTVVETYRLLGTTFLRDRPGAVP